MRNKLATALLLATAVLEAQPGNTAPGNTAKGSIAGRILGKDGKSLAGWHVAAGQWNYHYGRPELHLLQTTTTEKDGTFVIRNLDPGRYSVRAERPYGPKAPDENYAPTYYPGVIDVTAAAELEVRANATAGSIEFPVLHPRAFRIRGTVSGQATAEWIQSANALVPQDARHIEYRRQSPFEIEGVLPGTYVITASGAEATARVRVTVTDRDIDGLMIQTVPCPKVRAAITLDGAPLRLTPDSRPRISLNQVGSAIAFSEQHGVNGAVAVPCAPLDHYSLGLLKDPGTYIESVRLDGKEVAATALDLTAPGDKQLDIALASKAGTLQGAVRNTSAKALPGVPVTLWDPRTGFNVTSVSGPTGGFRFADLPPGNYRLAAWEELRPQPDGWGVQTVPAFRKEFESSSTPVTIGPGSSESVNPVLIPRSAIEAAGKRLHLTVAVVNSLEENATAAAVASPYTLARYVKSHESFDWDAIWKALRLEEPGVAFPPCGKPSEPCGSEIVPVSRPDQALLIVTGEWPKREDVYFRYLKKSDGGWEFSGVWGAFFHEGVRGHEVRRFGEKPFLRITTDQSQYGIATSQKLEEWFDLTQPGLEPVFSTTVEGGQSRFAFGVGREIRAASSFHRIAGRERIEVALRIEFNGPGWKQEAKYLGIYERPSDGGTFELQRAYSADTRAPIPTELFSQLADPFSELTNEKLLELAFAGLQAVARGSDADGKRWLRLVLENAKDTPEKSALLKLLGR